MPAWLSRRHRRAALVLALVVSLLVAACQAVGQDRFGPSGVLRGLLPADSSAPSALQRATATDQNQPVSAAPPRPAAATAARSASEPATLAQSGATQPGPLALDRMVMRTARLSLQVAEVDQAVDRARQLAQAGGGFVSASNTRLEQNRTVAELTLQVRADALDATLEALRGLGKVENETSSSQDVTEEYVDLEANLRNLQASESAIVRLMDRAQRIEDIISLQRELTNVRGQIERIQGRKTYLERRTDMATLSVSLHLPAAESGTSPGGGFDPVAIARRGWNASLGVLRGTAEVVIVVAAFSWWLVPFLAIGAYVYLHRRRPTTPAAA